MHTAQMGHCRTNSYHILAVGKTALPFVSTTNLANDTVSIWAMEPISNIHIHLLRQHIDILPKIYPISIYYTLCRNNGKLLPIQQEIYFLVGACLQCFGKVAVYGQMHYWHALLTAIVGYLSVAI